MRLWREKLTKKKLENTAENGNENIKAKRHKHTHHKAGNHKKEQNENDKTTRKYKKRDMCA